MCRPISDPGIISPATKCDAMSFWATLFATVSFPTRLQCPQAPRNYPARHAGHSKIAQSAEREQGR
jgi:hypothetical protein